MDRWKFIAVLVFGVLLGYAIGYGLSGGEEAGARVIASPNGGYGIIKTLSEAEKSIHVEVYVFTSMDIAEELVKAKERGVDVKVIIEGKKVLGANRKVAEYLKKNGVDVRIAPKEYKLMHAKIAIIDRHTAIVGSHNFSNSAIGKNREVSVVIKGSAVNVVESLFERDWIYSEEYKPVGNGLMKKSEVYL